MDILHDPELLKLTALSIAFCVGVTVCIYVVVRETIELKQRRHAKRLMYNDAVRQELKQKQAAQAQATPIEQQSHSNRQSFA